jgi:hypothetical protein
LWDGIREREIGLLSPEEQRRYPTLQLVNDIGLVETLVELQRSSYPPEPHSKSSVRPWDEARNSLGIPSAIHHYLYFTTRERAERAVEKIRAADLVAELKPAAGESDIKESWLVLVSNLEPTRPLFDFLSEVASEFQGEYDGFEAPLPTKS